LPEPANQQGRGDVIRQVGDDLARRGQLGGEVDRQRVAFDQAQAGRVGVAQVGDGCDRARVDLDGGKMCGVAFEDGAGQAAGAGADFGDVAAAQRPGLADDAADQIGVEQEVLAELVARGQPEPRDYIT
jgi:hypothetical protein